jgi:carbonic anhydrase
MLTVISDCGYTHNNDEALKTTLKAQHPAHSHDIDQLNFGTYESSER